LVIIPKTPESRIINLGIMAMVKIGND
jgi:hypothetical protein